MAAISVEAESAADRTWLNCCVTKKGDIPKLVCEKLRRSNISDDQSLTTHAAVIFLCTLLGTFRPVIQPESFSSCNTKTGDVLPRASRISMLKPRDFLIVSNSEHVYCNPPVPTSTGATSRTTSRPTYLPSCVCSALIFLIGMSECILKK